MLEHLPAWLGHMMRGVRAGADKVLIADPALRHGGGVIALTSPAFAAGAPMPVRFTQDGDGVSPPLAWTGVPPGTASLLLVVEDAGSPTPSPLVHAIVHRIDPGIEDLAQGAIRAGHGPYEVGRNSFGQRAWLAPDPPPGHGAHDYVFQLFALSRVPDLPDDVGRGAVVTAIGQTIIASGVLIGTYGRDG